MALALLTYWPVAASRADFLDSYADLDMANQGTLDGLGPPLVTGGRPVYLGALRIAFAFAHTISDLRVLRILGILGIGLLATVLFRVLTAAGVNRIRALAIPIVVCSLPTFQVWASWGVCYPYPYAAALAAIASVAANRMSLFRLGSREWFLYGALAAGVLTVAAATYQPAWGLFAACALVFLLVPSKVVATGRQLSRAYATFVGVSLVAIVVDAVLAKVLTRLLYGGAAGQSADRTQLVGDVLAKAHWFVREPLIGSARLWDISLTGWTIPLLVLLVSVVGLAIRVLPEGRLGAWRAGAVVTLIPLSYLPNLVIREDWASYRTRAGLTSIVAILVCLGIFAIFDRLRRPDLGPVRTRQPLRLSSWIPALAIAVLAVMGMVAARTSVRDYFALPQEQELAYVHQLLAAQHADQASSIDVIGCSWQNSLAPAAFYDEFGIPTCAAGWTPVAEVRLVLTVDSGHSPRIPIRLVTAETPRSNGATVIDLRGLRSEAAGR